MVTSQILENIWYLPDETLWRGKSRLYALSLRATGSLIINNDSLEFQARNSRIIIRDVLNISIKNFYSVIWIRVEYGEESRIQTAFFADASLLGWGGMLGGTRRIFDAVQHLNPNLSKTLSDQAFNTPTPSSTSQPQITVQPDYKLERIRVGSEVVNVPEGVLIKVKRSRTFEHSIEINKKTYGELGIEATLLSVVKASIRSNVGQTQGRTYQQSETVEYEVELNGKDNQKYELIWTDVWFVGSATIFQMGKTHILPFKFREHTELEIIPAK